jgi:hypothetical protein
LSHHAQAASQFAAVQAQARADAIARLQRFDTSAQPIAGWLTGPQDRHVSAAQLFKASPPPSDRTFILRRILEIGEHIPTTGAQAEAVRDAILGTPSATVAGMSPIFEKQKDFMRHTANHLTRLNAEARAAALEDPAYYVLLQERLRDVKWLVEQATLISDAVGWAGLLDKLRRTLTSADDFPTAGEFSWSPLKKKARTDNQ